MVTVWSRIGHRTAGRRPVVAHHDGRLGRFTLDLGIVRDSTLNNTNDYRWFSESFDGLIPHVIEAVEITHTLTPLGTAPALVSDTGAYFASRPAATRNRGFRVGRSNLPADVDRTGSFAGALRQTEQLGERLMSDGRRPLANLAGCNVRGSQLHDLAVAVGEEGCCAVRLVDDEADERVTL